MATWRFDPLDLEQVRRLGQLGPGRRIRVMLDARELAVGLIRGRLRRQHLGLSPAELNLRVLEELARVERTPPGPCLGIEFDESYVDAQARALGEDAVKLWEAVKAAARQEAQRGDSS